MGTQPASSGREQSRGEEIASSTIHGMGFISALVGTPILIEHASRQSGLKKLFNLIDHIMIYLLIAGTYTPFTLGVLHGAWGWTLFGLIWGLATIGMTLKIFKRMGHPVISTGMYLVMGWLILVAIGPLYAAVSTQGLLWLLAGAISYTAGVFFYATDDRLRYGHSVWHLFVLGGTVSHYFAVWYAI